MIQTDLVGENLACRRGERLIFRNLSFRLGPGEALLVTGANGSGKSSFLRLAATLLRADEGRLCWGTVPIGHDLPSHRGRLHHLGHLDAIKLALTPREMIESWVSLRQGVPMNADPLAAFGLEAAADLPCRWLSAGQRRRLALCRLTAIPADLWLLDEPTAALDAESQARLEAAIRAHVARGGRAIIATHAPLAIGATGTLSLDAHAPQNDGEPGAELGFGSEPGW